MKITTAKIIRELEKKGLGNWTPNQDKLIVAVKEIRNIIDEILKEKKGITIKK